MLLLTPELLVIYLSPKAKGSLAKHHLNFYGDDSQMLGQAWQYAQLKGALLADLWSRKSY